MAVHADWSMDPRKRWMTTAHPDGDRWRIEAPEPVGPLDTWMPRLRARAQGGPIALGVDLPLGVPRAYARTLPHKDFPAFLRSLSPDSAFFKVCATLDDITPDRPFYPARGLAGMTRAAHAQALGFESAADLSRACDRATPTRPAGAPLFWTLGANQTGKAAISAWRDWLLPAMAVPNPPRLWPFEGRLDQLLAPDTIVVAETYPAEAMRQRGLKMNGSKRRHTDRLALAPALLTAMTTLNVHPTTAMHASTTTGFGPDAPGEDRLDTVLGLIGLLAVLQGSQPDAIPHDPWIRDWEGWVMGQTLETLR